MRTFRAVLGCAALLLLVVLPPLFFRSSTRLIADAAGSEDDAWHGAITVLRTSNQNNETNENYSGTAVHHIDRHNLNQRQVYTDIRLGVENDEHRAWLGPARVNLTLSEHTYNFNSSSGPAGYEESGYDATGGGATAAPGRVRLDRYIDPDNPKKATCHIEVDAEDGWYTSSNRPELQVEVKGHSWAKSKNDSRDTPVNQKKTLAPWFYGIEFDCDPKATSLSGEKRITNPNGTSSEMMTYSLRRGAVPQVEVEIIPPPEYEQWLPQAGEDEKTAGNFLDIGIVAHEKDKPGDKPPIKVKKYKLELVDVSKEKGVCLNWPAKDAKSEFDLKFDQEVNPYIKITDGESAQKAETKEEDLDYFMVTVESFDWGGWGKLQVTAELEDGTPVQAHVRGDSNSYALALPKDDNSNHIADFWEKMNGAKTEDAASDEDERPPGEHNGDGLSLYEEYRGVRVNGAHKPLDPNRKDVFIWDVDSLGTGNYAATKFNINLVQKNEVGSEGGALNPNVVNPNRGNATQGAVYVLKLVKAEVSGGDAGETYTPKGGRAWVPRDVVEVRINSDRIRQAGGNSPQDVVDSEISSTIAHELGHASHLQHHGFTDYSADGDVLCRTSKGVVNYLCDAEDDPSQTNKGKPQAKKQGASCFTVAVKGGAWSGDASCVMRYNSGNFYEDPGGNCEWKHNGALRKGRVGDYQSAGVTYCKSKEGTGVNARGANPNMAGDATLGECVFDLCINSAKH